MNSAIERQETITEKTRRYRELLQGMQERVQWVLDHIEDVREIEADIFADLDQAPDEEALYFNSVAPELTDIYELVYSGHIFDVKEDIELAKRNIDESLEEVDKYLNSVDK